MLLHSSRADAVRQLHEDVFTLPFTADDSNSNEPELNAHAEQLRGSAQLQAAVAAALGCFKTKKQALLHGDLHSGSVMTDGMHGGRPSLCDSPLPSILLTTSLTCLTPASLVP